MGDPVAMGAVMDDAMMRMGLYTAYGSSLTGIFDYAYANESSTVLDYDGYINRALAVYPMNISTAIQSLMTVAQNNVDENGKVLLEKFSADYEPAAESLVSYRRMYLGPDAVERFGFNRQVIYGGDEKGNNDGYMPIALELTYTIVR
jgi:hypothetical protein